MTKIYIGQECDGFFVSVKTEGGSEIRSRFSQEDTVEKLVEVFNSLGFEDVEYEEVC